MRGPTPYIVVLVATVVWCGLLFAPPVIASVDGPHSGFAHFAYRFYAPICHQLDSRSLHVLGFKLAVCERCCSIYFSFLLGVLVFPLFKRNIATSELHWLLLAVAPMVVDVGLDIAGIHPATAMTRMVSGSFFGVVAGIVLLPSLLNGLASLFHHHTQAQGCAYESKA